MAYIQIIELQTGRFAAGLQPLLDEPPTFRNLDVVRVDRT